MISNFLYTVLSEARMMVGAVGTVSYGVERKRKHEALKVWFVLLGLLVVTKKMNTVLLIRDSHSQMTN